jgi:hypothetical protein
MKREPSNIDVADPYSNLLRALGREAESEKVVADAVAAGGTAAGWRGLISLGNLQTQFNKREAAAASFDEAIRREDPKTRDATRTIVDLLVAQERFPLALPYLESLAKCRRICRTEGLDAVLDKHHLDAIVAPTPGRMPIQIPINEERSMFQPCTA